MVEMSLKSKKIRPLTKNEKFLLITLGFILILWGSFRFIIAPQRERIFSLKNEKMELDTKITDMNNTLEKGKKIKKENDILDVEREQILSRYFPILDQSQIIYLLNDLMKDDRVAFKDYNFDRPSIENLGDMEVKQMGISIPFSGSYDGIVDVIRSIGTSPRRILVDNISIDRKDDNEISGNMYLKIYGLEGLAETNPNIIQVATVDNLEEGSLFGSFEDYVETSNESSEDTDELYSPTYSSTGDENLKKVQLLTDFESINYTFIPSNEYIKGDVIPSTIRKSGKYSLRFEYNIIALGDENRAYIDLLGNNLVFKYPPETISLWVNSFGYSPGILGMRFRTQDGKNIDVSMSEGISWVGWSNINVSPPQDLNLYPLELTHIYYELPYNRDDYGVMLIDKLEAFYPHNEYENANNDLAYEFYIVKAGDTVSGIAQHFYGSNKYKNEIMENNGIASGEALPVGKVLVLVKHEGVSR